MTKREDFGKNIRQLRRSTGFSQKELAQIAGVSEAAISRYETGQRLPMVGTAIKLTLALGCTRDDLLKKSKGTDK